MLQKHSLPFSQSFLTFEGDLEADNQLSDQQTMSASSSNQISRRLGPSEGWRSKRVRIAMALRQQGWSYQTISEHLFVSPKSIMRDIKCFVINPRNLPRPWIGSLPGSKYTSRKTWILINWISSSWNISRRWCLKQIIYEKGNGLRSCQPDNS